MANTRKMSCRPFLWCLLASLLLQSTILSLEAGAASIVFNPGDVAVDVSAGDQGSATSLVTLTGIASPTHYATFRLVRIGGNLPDAWLSNNVNMTLSAMQPSRPLAIPVKIPQDAGAGEYTGVFRTQVVNSNGATMPASLTLLVRVAALAACKEVPTFEGVASSQGVIDIRNNKQVPLALQGTVISPSGCEISNLWYQLTDEYGELNGSASLPIAADGSFSVAVPIATARKGTDKDGRLYSITFLAENQAGVGESNEIVAVVTHDSRDKK